jgi:PhnB protein
LSAGRAHTNPRPRATHKTKKPKAQKMSKPIVEPYLFFNGNCEQAVAFYRNALDAKVEMMMRFKESPESPPPGTVPPGWDDKIMHASFRVGETMVMASDGCEEGAGFSGFSLTLAVATEIEADRYFNALADGGKVTMPLGKTFWSPRFGMLQDRFGVGWMINVFPQAPK